MFGFGKKKKKIEKPKRKSNLDKLIMGAIVGGAVGSVVGMSIAPQKGKETREIIAQKSKELIKKGQESLEKLSDLKDKKEVEAKIEQETKKEKKKLIPRMVERLFGRSKKVKKEIMKDADMKKIPNEVD